jgi:hypothetical protein
MGSYKGCGPCLTNTQVMSMIFHYPSHIICTIALHQHDRQTVAYTRIYQKRGGGGGQVAYNTKSTTFEVQGSFALTYMVGFIPLNLRSQEMDKGVPHAE